jgi:phosphoglycolate phosphatase
VPTGLAGSRPVARRGPAPGTRCAVVCLDMAGTTVVDDGAVAAAFAAAVAVAVPGADAELRAAADELVQRTMGRAKIEVLRSLVALADRGPAVTLDDLADRALVDQALVPEPLSSGQHERAVDALAAFEAEVARAVTAGTVRALPGARDVIAQLRGAGVGVCLTTGFPAATRDLILDRLGWSAVADLVLSPDDVGRGRPWPDMALTALMRLGGASVAELAVVGDTPTDMAFGVHAGAGWVVGVRSGGWAVSALHRAGATAVVRDVCAVPALVGVGSRD